MTNTKSNGHHKEESPLKFPQDFTIKIMGRADNNFETVAITIVKQHFPKLTPDHIHKKLSKDKNFLSLSITVYAKSKEQLDALYQELSGIKEVLMVL